MVRVRPNWRRRWRNTAGFTLVEVLAVTAIITSLASKDSFSRAKQKTYEIECQSNLRQIYTFLQMYVQENGHYPRASFYPKDINGPRSIKTMLEGVPAEMWLCPGLPDSLRNNGLNFVYNDQLAGKSDGGIGNAAKKWVLIEFSSCSNHVPTAHPAGYNILFADGHIITSKRLPNRITAAWRQPAE